MRAPVSFCTRPALWCIDPGMTYCVGLLLEAGLVMIADTRTNAGVDNFSSFRKLHVLAQAEDRQIFACSSGSLSMSQSAIALLREGLPPAETGEAPRTVAEAPSMFRVAQLVGESVQSVNRSVGAALAEANLGSSVSLLLGGRIGDSPPALYLVYSAGNFIECTAESPFLQIGETKYGKPILDRGIRHATPLGEAVKVALLSFDSAMRSNLGVARPLDLMVMPADPGAAILTRRIEPDDEYFNQLSLRWSLLLHEATGAIPDPPFLEEAGEAGRAAAE
jgi:putative proteasome-type protease